MDISKFTEEQLRDELKRREEEREAAALKRRQELHERILKNINALLDVQREHGRTSCSDAKPDNYMRCNRCDLLRIKKDGWVEEDIELNIEILHLNRNNDR